MGKGSMGDRKTDLALYRMLWRQAKPYRAHLGALFGLNVLFASLKLLAPLPLMIAVDSVLGSQPLPEPWNALLTMMGSKSATAILLLAAGLLVSIALFIQVVGLATGLLSTYIGEKLVLACRAALFRHAQRLSLSYHDSRGTTDSTYRIQYEAPAIQWIMVEGIIPLLIAGLTLAAMVYVTACINLQLALIALVVTPPLYMLSEVFGRRLRHRSEEMRKHESSTFSVIQEVLAGVRVVKAFGQEDREEERFVSHSRLGLRARLQVLLAAGALGLLVGLITSLGTALILYLGVRHVQAGVMTLGELLLVLAYVAQIYGPLETISKKMADLQGSLASAERVSALLEERVDVPESPQAMPLARASGAVVFRKVSFAYPEGPRVLHDISFTVMPGTKVGIAGKTGAGKSTLLNLLIRFYDPAEGQILLDDVDLREYRLADLRNQFAMVLQEPVLFATSIAENIAYARPGAAEEAIVAAARAANAHEFIEALPHGYQTRVGERGMQLSGGERQRISLARAFLKDAPMLLLDEPTSSVDVKTEALIMDALGRLMQGRTTFIIAHRLGTLETCDLRLVLEQGRLQFQATGTGPLSGGRDNQGEPGDAVQEVCADG
jgi:ATP-binding cassette subfamily B protein